MKETRVIIAGGRDFNDYNLLKETAHEIIAKYDNPIKIVSGTCRGADRLGEKYAYENQIRVERFPADWNKLGRSAGYVRNVEMAIYASDNDNIGVLIAFWDGKSKGTKHMIDAAKKYGLEIHVIRY